MFGFGKGKIELELEKYSYSPGETVRGTIKLRLKKPVMARGVNAGIFAQQKTTRGYGRDRHTDYTTIFEFKQPLDREKEYPANQDLNYNFEIKIPESVVNKAAIPEEALGTVAKIIGALSRSSSAISWYVTANLDVPKGIDVSKKVQINVA